MALKQTLNSLYAPDGSEYVTLTDGGGNLVGGAGPGGASTVEGAGASGATSVGNPVRVAGTAGTVVPSAATTGQTKDVWVNANGAVMVGMPIVTSGDGVVNTSISFPAGLTGSAAQSPQGVAGYVFNGTTWDRTRTIVGSNQTTGVGVTGIAVVPTTVSAAGSASTATSAVASGLVLKATAGNLYSISATSGASAGYVMVFDAASAPADGAVTPVDVFVIAANASVSQNYNIPIRCSTGITLVFSTTGPFSKTASATAFMAGQFV